MFHFICFDSRFGIYPLTCFELPQPIPPRQQASSPEVIDSVKSNSPEPLDNECRRVVNMMCNVKTRDEGPGLIVIVTNLMFISLFLIFHNMECAVLSLVILIHHFIPKVDILMRDINAI